ncbi:MAG: hypothetical protein K2O42_10660 [Oscillospiraceae bacterium]|nr:hypothetical protein [Oscillospiraceae bacterium]
MYRSDLMLAYCVASFFVRVHCPAVLMGVAVEGETERHAKLVGELTTKNRNSGHFCCPLTTLSNGYHLEHIP